jgi:hypothetical protein
MTDRNKLLADFGVAAGALMEAELNALPEESRKDLAAALENGEGSLRILVQLTPLVVIGGIRPTDKTLPLIPLFKCPPDRLPSEASH